MAETPIGEAENFIILAQNLRMLVEQNSGNDFVFALMKETHIDKSHPETRIDHGRKRVYNHAAPDIMIRTLVSLSKDLFGDLKTRTQRNSVGILPRATWKIETTASDGTRKLVEFQGKMFGYSISKVDGPPADSVDAEMQIRIEGETAEVSDIND